MISRTTARLKKMQMEAITIGPKVRKENRDAITRGEAEDLVKDRECINCDKLLKGCKGKPQSIRFCLHYKERE